MNTRPRSCSECDFYSSCDSGMNLSGCAFYGPKEKKKFDIKSFFSKFFSK